MVGTFRFKSTLCVTLPNRVRPSALRELVPMTSMERFFPGLDKGTGGRGILNGAARDLQRRVLEGKSAELAVKLDLTLLADGGKAAAHGFRGALKPCGNAPGADQLKRLLRGNGHARCEVDGAGAYRLVGADAHDDPGALLLRIPVRGHHDGGDAG